MEAGEWGWTMESCTCNIVLLSCFWSSLLGCEYVTFILVSNPTFSLTDFDSEKYLNYFVKITLY